MPAHAREIVSASAPSPVSEPYAATVVASNDARWSQERLLGIERVTLDEGLLHVHVRPQKATERFLVILPDGTLEVRGTTFDVQVDHGATTSVRVDEGIVELRVGTVGPARLAAGDAWPTPLAPRPAPAPLPRVAVTHSGAPAPVPAASAAPYADAMRLLRDGRYEEAAALFHAFAEAPPRASQAEDASFLEAVALARAGRSDAAALAAEHHLASFPSSFHRKEASILVARAAVQRGDCTKARSTLAPWERDPDAEATLRACP